MMLDLTPEDAQRLRGVLTDHLPDLERESARTDEKTLRHELVQRVDLCKDVIERLTAPSADELERPWR